MKKKPLKSPVNKAVKLIDKEIKSHEKKIQLLQSIRQALVSGKQ